eukprot:TRINITY_DN12962_c0_g1_i2.p1 TRINITY_DN12962_c0_g1~~TRINITY_DN12962_c0_g1_i2.p1  ORF type:complete len:493 (+),score=114.13 TRINITY_DN12962_c0_g1_i2:41-1519(+)
MKKRAAGRSQEGSVGGKTQLVKIDPALDVVKLGPDSSSRQSATSPASSQSEQDWRDEVGRRLEDFERRVNEQMESWKQQTSQTMLVSQQTSQSSLASLSGRLKALEEEQPRVEVKLAQLGGGVKGARDQAVEQAKQLALLEEKLQEEQQVFDEQIRTWFSEVGAELARISTVVSGELHGQQAKLEVLVSEGVEEAVGLAISRYGHQDEVETLLLDLTQRVYALERPCSELPALRGQAAERLPEHGPLLREEQAKIYGAVAKLQNLEEEVLRTRSKLEKQEVHLASCQARLDSQEELQRVLATRKASLLGSSRSSEFAIRLQAGCPSPAVQHSPRPAVQHSPRLAGQAGLQQSSQYSPRSHDFTEASGHSPRVQCFQISSDAEEEYEADGELQGVSIPEWRPKRPSGAAASRGRRRLTPVTETEDELVSRQYDDEVYRSRVLELPPAEPWSGSKEPRLPGSQQTAGCGLELVCEHYAEDEGPNLWKDGVHALR